MKKETLKDLDIDIYSETLDSGLEVYLVPMKNVKRYFMTYATRYGSLVTEFMPQGSKKMVKVPNGVAHFLEHKMFEQESGSNPFEFFGKSGTYVNASTGYEATRYICSGMNNFEENLEYLINFVNCPYFTDENVEKEKGIIIEELNMYKDNPESAIDNTTRFNLFHKDQHRYDIGGEVSDVEKITKEDLYLCYDNFYQPKNMFILIVGNFQVEKTLQMIRELFKNRKTKYQELPKIKEYNEPYAVRKKQEIVHFNVEVPKLCYALKIKKSDLRVKNEYILDLYLNIILKILFGNTSLFSDEAKANDLFSGFYYSFDSTDSYVVISFFSETKKQNELLQLIFDTLNKRGDIIDEESFVRCRKTMIANMVKSSCYIDAVSDTIFDDLISYKQIIYDRVDIIRNLDYNSLINFSERLTLDNNCMVSYVNKNDNDFKFIDFK